MEERETSKTMEESASMSMVTITLTTDMLSTGTATMVITKLGGSTKLPKREPDLPMLMELDSESDPEWPVEDPSKLLSILVVTNTDLESEMMLHGRTSNGSLSTEDQTPSDLCGEEVTPSLTREVNS
jgi:hypothetical protein